MSSAESLDRQALADDFKKQLTGKLATEKVDAGVEAIRAATAAYSAVGSLEGVVFYVEFRLEITEPNGRAFKGQGGGLVLRGDIGQLGGYVYTSDLTRLYGNTHAFAFWISNGFNISFFDRDSNVLGHFQGTLIDFGDLLPIGGGTGYWLCRHQR